MEGRSSATTRGGGGGPSVGAHGTNASGTSGSHATDRPSSGSHAPSNDGTRTITFTIHGARNLRGSRADKTTSFVRIQFPGCEVKESAVIRETSSPDYALSYTVAITPAPGQPVLERLCNDALSITVLEQVNKDKNVALGVATFTGLQRLVVKQVNSLVAAADLGLARPELLPLTLRDTIALQPAPPPTTAGSGPSATGGSNGAGGSGTAAGGSGSGSKGSAGVRAEGENAMTLDIEVTTGGVATPHHEVVDGFLLKLALGDIWSVPDEWSLRDAVEKDLQTNIFEYRVAMQIPLSDKDTRMVQLPVGTLVPHDPAKDDEAPSKVKLTPLWAPKNAGRAPVDTSRLMERLNAPTGPPPPPPSKRVAFHAAHYVWLSKETLQYLSRLHDKKIPMLFQFSREVSPRWQGNMTEHELALAAAPWSALMTLDLRYLVSPCARGVKGTLAFLPVDDAHATERPSTAHDAGDPATALPAVGIGAAAAAAAQSVGSDAGQFDEERVASAYLQQRTRLYIKLEMNRPYAIIQAAPPTTISLEDILPQKVMTEDALFEQRAIKSEDDFKSEIYAMIEMLHEEMEKFARNRDPALPFDANPTFLTAMTHNGLSWQIRERMKLVIAQIVRDRFRVEESFHSKADQSVFLNRLHIYLVDQIHKILYEYHHSQEADTAALANQANSAAQGLKWSSLPETTYMSKAVNSMVTEEHQALRIASAVAEYNMDVATAYQILHHALAKYQKTPAAAYDLALFMHRNHQFEHAHVLITEVVTRWPSFTLGRILMAVMWIESGENLNKAAAILEAIQQDPNSSPYVAIQCCLSLGALHERTSESIISGEWFRKGRQHYQDWVKSSGSRPVPHGLWSIIFASTVLINARQVLQIVLAQAVAESGITPVTYLWLIRSDFQNSDWSQARRHIENALAFMHQPDSPYSEDLPNLYALQGDLEFHCCRVLGTSGDRETRHKYARAAIAAYEVTLRYEEDHNITPNELPVLLDHYAQLLILLMDLPDPLSYAPDRTIEPVHKDAFAKAESLVLRACKINGSNPYHWITLARLYMVAGSWDKAEEALTEANVLNYMDARVWLHLAAVCINQEQALDAQQALVQALDIGVHTIDDLKTTGIAFMEAEEYRAAAECFHSLIALQRYPFVQYTPMTDDAIEDLQTMLTQCIALSSGKFLAKEGTTAGSMDDPLSPGTELSASRLDTPGTHRFSRSMLTAHMPAAGAAHTASLSQHLSPEQAAANLASTVSAAAAAAAAAVAGASGASINSGHGGHQQEESPTVSRDRSIGGSSRGENTNRLAGKTSTTGSTRRSSRSERRPHGNNRSAASPSGAS
ncbi:hypothetical protein CXG81DRAFT_17768 [Caulochytrium protostelioides]|uniref:TPR-like protein n=1 Tax=Caulochytrium protostelioides TaxID=1555241 RepID=A0A4P9X134_9FUNG|nr:TPR-like protein [Caulochytrium protostelioides]RKP02558.1 hypothetical protein CXG81DRAFT_17768 [Caulochytrium protostelioides]|eukprot:RKP02558.1 hypothetical protein CXG81DRAFT_17768 [Caulochytrium protostelioides]